MWKKNNLNKKDSTSRGVTSVRSLRLSYILKIAKTAESEKIKSIFNLHTYSFYINRRKIFKNWDFYGKLTKKMRFFTKKKKKSVKKAYKNFIDDLFKIIWYSYNHIFQNYVQFQVDPFISFWVIVHAISEIMVSRQTRRRRVDCVLLYLLRKRLGKLTYSSNFGKRKVASYSIDVREYFKWKNAQIFFPDLDPP